ncbi:MAG: hypothetical protein ABI668_12380 [Sphingorhabdus sp.]
MGYWGKAILASGAAAILATSAAPAMAAIPRHGSDSVMTASGEYNGWGRRYRHRHHDRVDGGDILAGIAVLAGIAIIADAASKDSRRERAPQPYPEDNRPYDSSDSDNGNDVGSAVQSCSAAAERSAGENARVDEIRSVTRDGAGWRVEGDLSGGDASNFVCGTTNGQVDFIELDGDRSI